MGSTQSTWGIFLTRGPSMSELHPICKCCSPPGGCVGCLLGYFCFQCQTAKNCSAAHGDSPPAMCSCPGLVGCFFPCCAVCHIYGKIDGNIRCCTACCCTWCATVQQTNYYCEKGTPARLFMD